MCENVLLHPELEDECRMYFDLKFLGEVNSLKEQNIPDSTFVPPVGVEFEDVVKKYEKMGADLEGTNTDFEGRGTSLEDFKK